MNHLDVSGLTFVTAVVVCAVFWFGRAPKALQFKRIPVQKHTNETNEDIREAS